MLGFYAEALADIRAKCERGEKPAWWLDGFDTVVAGSWSYEMRKQNLKAFRADCLYFRDNVRRSTRALVWAWVRNTL